MYFIKDYIFNKKHSKDLVIIFVSFLLFYVVCNMPFFHTMVNDNLALGPFPYSSININIFNMDPIQLFGLYEVNFLHPFSNLISVFFIPLNKGGFTLYIIMLIESFIGALSIVLMYIYLININLSKKLSYAITLLFGFFSFSISSTLIPDSYVLAQFVILLSLVYIQYSTKNKVFNPIGYAILGILNFGITVTNLIPYSFNAILAIIKTKTSDKLKKFSKAFLIGVVILLTLTTFQFAISNSSWIQNISETVETKGQAYAVPCTSENVVTYSKGFIFSPIMTSPLAFKSDLLAVVTDLNREIPIQNKIIVSTILLLCVLSIILNINKKETWFLLSIIMFAVFLHLVKGFGLATYYYDVYLYAGNYLCTIPILIGLLLTKVKNKNLLNGIFITLCILTVCILINNLYMHKEIFELIQLNYKI